MTDFNLKQTLVREKIIIASLTSIQFFNILDFVVLMPLGPVLMRYFNISPAQFAILASSYSVSAGLIGIFYSSIADKFERKKLTMFVLSLFIVTTLFCGLAPNYYLLLTSRILAGVFGGCLTPSIYAIITDIIPFERRGKAMGSILATFSITSIIGIPIGLAIADYFSWRYTFIFVAGGAMLSLIWCLYILPVIEVKAEKIEIKKDLNRLMKLALHKDFRLPFLCIMLLTGSGFLLFPFLSPYAVQNVGLQESDLKYIYLVGGLLTVVTSKIVGALTDKLGTLRVFLPSLILSLPFIYLYTSVENLSLGMLLLISTPFMAFITARFIPVMTLITSVPSEEDRGAFMGLLVSYRSFISAAATAFSGFCIAEASDGKLIHFNKMGYLSIFLSIVAIYCVFRMTKRLKVGL